MRGLFSDKLSHDDQSLLGCCAMSAAKYSLRHHTQGVQKRLQVTGDKGTTIGRNFGHYLTIRHNIISQKKLNVQ